MGDELRRHPHDIRRMTLTIKMHEPIAIEALIDDPRHHIIP
jgi:hypothetical protein